MAKMIYDRDNGDGTYTQFFDDGSAHQLRYGTNSLISQGSASMFAGYRPATSDSSSSSDRLPPTRSGDTKDEERYINYLREALKESSGFQRTKLQQELDIATKDREERLQAAQVSANASMYGADKSLQGTQYSSDQSLAGTKYSSDAGERNSGRTLEGTKYGADSSLAGTKYNADTDRYKFDATQPLERADRALSFIKTYTDLSQRPDDYLQASNYARLGRQVEGMPVMVNELLGQINPTAYSRSGSYNMPQNAAVATFGTHPMQLVNDRSAMPPAPTMGQATGGGVIYPTNGGTYTATQSQNGYAAPPIPGSYLSSGENTMIAPPIPGTAGGVAAQRYAAVQTPQTAPQNAGYMQGGYDNRQPAWVGQMAQPRGATGQLAPQNQAGQDALAQMGQTLIRRGAHTLGNQAKERLSTTDLGLTNSSLKNAGGVPDDYWLTYDRTRIGNEGSMAAA